MQVTNKITVENVSSGLIYFLPYSASPTPAPLYASLPSNVRYIHYPRQVRDHPAIFHLVTGGGEPVNLSSTN